MSKSSMLIKSLMSYEISHIQSKANKTATSTIKYHHRIVIHVATFLHLYFEKERRKNRKHHSVVSTARTTHVTRTCKCSPPAHQARAKDRACTWAAITTARHSPPGQSMFIHPTMIFKDSLLLSDGTQFSLTNSHMIPCV